MDRDCSRVLLVVLGLQVGSVPAIAQFSQSETVLFCYSGQITSAQGGPPPQPGFPPIGGSPPFSAGDPFHMRLAINRDRASSPGFYVFSSGGGGAAIQIGSRGYSASDGNFVVRSTGISADILGPAGPGVPAGNTLAFLMDLSGYTGLDPNLILPNQLPSVSLATNKTISSRPQLNLWGSFSGTISGNSCGPLEPAALQATPQTPPTITPGEAYATAFLASGGRGGYRWSLTAGTLPAGFTFSNIGILAYTGNQLPAVGVYPISIRVTDVAGNTASLSTTLNVVTPTPLTISTSALAPAVVGNAYSSAALAATGGVQPYRWALATGSSLPAGFSISSAGVISAPSTFSAAPGSYRFTVRLSDNSVPARTVDRELSLNVLAPTLFHDPRPLVTERGIIPNAPRALAGLNSPVSGIAADGTSQGLLVIPAPANESVQVTVLSDSCTLSADLSTCAPASSIDNFGGLARPGFALGDPLVSTLSAPVTAAAGGHFAFVVYRAPADFVRLQPVSLVDTFDKSRISGFRVTFAGGTVQHVPLQIVRPPVVLIHGYNSERRAWDQFRSLFSTFPFSVFAVEYGNEFPFTESDGTFSPALTANFNPYSRVRNSHFGLQHNACRVINEVRDFIADYAAEAPLNNGSRIRVIASAADIVAHSMGGLIAKFGSQQNCYRTPSNFRAGMFHKIISLGTPYYGTPQATIQTSGNATCSALFATQSGTFSFRDFRPNLRGYSAISGAVNDLAGRGDGQNLSPVLAEVNATAARNIPTAVIAGDMGTYFSSVDTSPAFGAMYTVCGPITPVSLFNASQLRFSMLGIILSVVNGPTVGKITVIRERYSPEILDGISFDYSTPAFIVDDYALYLTSFRFKKQFDPRITPQTATAGSTEVASDGSVPVLSARGGYPVTTTLNNHLHSIGWHYLLLPSLAESDHLQNSFNSFDLVRRFLNTSVLDRLVFNRP